MVELVSKSAKQFQEYFVEQKLSKKLTNIKTLGLLWVGSFPFGNRTVQPCPQATQERKEKQPQSPQTGFGAEIILWVTSPAFTSPFLIEM